MPRMKNAAEPAKSFTTLHRFGFVSPPRTQQSPIEEPKKRVTIDITLKSDDESKPGPEAVTKPDVDEDVPLIPETVESVTVQTKGDNDILVCEESDDRKLHTPTTDDMVEPSKRSRKPSQKILQMLEFEEASKEKVVPSSHTAASSASSSPEKLVVQKPDKNKTCTKSVVKAKLSSPHPNDDSQSDLVLESLTCCACNTVVSRYSKAFRQIYCNPCIYMFRKYLKDNMLAKCNDGCDGDNVVGCQGCRTRAVNMSLPLNRQVDSESAAFVTPIRRGGNAVAGDSEVKTPKMEAKTPKPPVTSNITARSPIVLQSSALPSSQQTSQQNSSLNLKLASPLLAEQLKSKLKYLKLNPSKETTTTTLNAQGQTVYRVIPSKGILVSTSPNKASPGGNFSINSPIRLQTGQIGQRILIQQGHGLPPKLITLSGTQPRPVQVLSGQQIHTTPPVPTGVDSPSESSGPRIKHVSRSASIAQGEPAMIGGSTNLRLSALPADEKSKILTQPIVSSSDEDDHAEDVDDGEDDDDRSDILTKHSAADSILDFDSEEEFIPKTKPKLSKPKYMPKKMSGSGGMGKRRPRCGNCSGCKATNCKVCVFCKDMKKYGGPGKMKQCCIERRCVNKDGPRYEGKTGDHDEDSYDGFSHKQRRSEPDVQPVVKKRGRPPKRHQPEGALSIVDDESVDDTLDTDFFLDDLDEAIANDLTNRPLTELLRVASSRLKGSSLSAAPPPAAPDPTSLNLPIVTADGTVISDQNPGFSLDENLHRVMADFIDTYDIDKVWEQGVAVVSSQSQPVRVLCFLCGSGGLTEMLYCSVCCEPFHSFCLSETERRKVLGSDDWLCRKCKFCCVCGKLENLLSCDRCSRSYHTDCLAEDYNNSPTSAGVWVCSNCVKCTSCGATTPGGPNDHWNSDYSLCASCEKLKLKGNFCPVCGLCYTDDDWDCKMIQCSTCDSWTHADCENLPDDLYELIGFISDDEAQYICRKCKPAASCSLPQTAAEKPDWLLALESLKTKGFSIILTSLLDKKFCQSIAEINQDELSDFYQKNTEDLKTFVIQELTGAAAPSQSKSDSDPTSSASVNTQAAERIQEVIEKPDSMEQTSELTSSDVPPPPSSNLLVEESQNTEELMSSTPQASDKNTRSTRQTRSQAAESQDVIDKTTAATVTDSEAEVKVKGKGEATPQHKNTRRSTRITRQTEETVATDSQTESSGEAALPAKSTRSKKLKQAPPTSDSAENVTAKSARKLRSATGTEDEEKETKLVYGKKSNGKRLRSRHESDDDDTSEADSTPVRRSTRQSLVHSTPKPELVKKEPANTNGDLSSPDPPPSAKRRKRNETIEPLEEQSAETEPGCRRSKRESKLPKQLEDSEVVIVNYRVSGSNKSKFEGKGEKYGQEKTTAVEESADQLQMDCNAIMTADQNNISLSDSICAMNDPVDLAVRFKDVEWMEPIISYESLVEGNRPVDLKSIQQRISSYHTVADFVDDVVRVLQSALTRSKYEGSKTYKHLLAAKKLFKQEMSQLFPWYEVTRSAYWDHNLYTPKGMLEKSSLPPSSEHTYALWLKKDDIRSDMLTQPSPYKQTPVKVQSVPDVNARDGTAADMAADTVPPLTVVPQTSTIYTSMDSRCCQFCAAFGDDLPNECGRLIYAGADDWVHVNCALWSAEVFEEVDGTLQKVHAAIARGKQLDCIMCKTRGATVGCCARGCVSNYHYRCARLSGCLFMEDKQVFCPSCTDHATGVIIPYDKCSVLRTVTVDFAHVKMKKSWQRGFKPDEISILAGSMTVENLGYVIPDSDYLNVLVPVDYCISRVYWSTKTPYQRCVYRCTVTKLDTKNLMKDTTVTIPHVTVCHDPTNAEFTPPAQLCYKYPQIFPPSLYERVLVQGEHADESSLDQVTYHSLSSACLVDPSHPLSGLSERTRRLLGRISPEKLSKIRSQGVHGGAEDLANLIGIAGALNRAAHKSQWKRARRALKNATVLYGSSEPQLSGNINDDVAEILDLVDEDGSLSEQEFDERDVFILRDVDDSTAAEVVETINCMSEDQAQRQGGVQAVMQAILDRRSNKALTSNSSSTTKESQLPQEPKQTICAPTIAVTSPADEPEAIPDLPLRSAVRPSSTLSVESNQSSQDSASFRAYSSGSSQNDSDGPDDFDMEVDNNVEPRTPLLSPPKIVITDFSFDEAGGQEEPDPFSGVSATSSSVSVNTKDKLKLLVQKRSEGTVDPQATVSQESDKCQDSSADTQTLTSAVTSLCERKDEGMDHMISEAVGDSAQKSHTGTQADKEEPELSSLDVTKEDDCPEVKAEEGRVKSVKRKYRGVSRKAKFSNDLLSTSAYTSGSVIRTRERTPDSSDVDSCGSDSAADGEGESDVERLVVPPCHNCVIRGKQLNSQLVHMLAARVVVDKLEDDSDDEDTTPNDDTLTAADEVTPSFTVPYSTGGHSTVTREAREASPPRDISREVKKDIINYCEESSSSSETDEEDLCRPRSLRQRGKAINYDEDKSSDDNEGSDGDHQPKAPAKLPKARPTTGRIVINKDGTIRSRSENIPSELQKTISDAIRKARERERNIAQAVSYNQTYAGAMGQVTSYSLHNNTRRLYNSKGPNNDRQQLIDYSVLPRLKSSSPVETELTGDNCQLMMTAHSMQSSALPLPSAEEEVSAGVSNTSRHGPSESSVTVTKRSSRTKKASSVILAFQIESDDGFTFKADNWNDAWRGITDSVKDLRLSRGFPALSFSAVNGLQMFGLEHTSVAYFTEQLYGARYCHNYRFKFHNPPLFECDDLVVETDSGSIRSEPYKSRRPPDMFSFLDSRYRKKPPPPSINNTTGGGDDNDLSQLSSRRATSMDLPMAMRFRHVKTNAKEATVVYSSGIHGRGLFCKRPIDSGEMVIEYAGEVIRHSLCDQREKYYDRRGIGCYMFRIDDQWVVDATMKGNAARFINHSCDPNCFSKVIDVGGEKHIVIFANRSIQVGEELTYDYKFPIEEVKIRCTCGAKKCRGFLN